MDAEKQREENKESAGRSIKRISRGKREGEAGRETQRKKMVPWPCPSQCLRASEGGGEAGEL